MRKRSVSLGILVLALSFGHAGVALAQERPAPAPSAAEKALPEIAERAKPCVALITIRDASNEEAGSGSGFLVSSDGRVVTNNHVIEGAHTATAKFADGKEIAVVGVLAADEERDIAVLQVDGRDLPSLPLGDIASLHVGDEIVVFGSPLGLSASLSTGVVAAMRERGTLDLDRDDPSPLTRGKLGWGLQITAAISPGSSGSPIMNRRGEVVGVAVGIMTRGQNLNFGVPVSVVKETLAKVPANAPARPFGGRAGGGESSGVAGNIAISAAVVLALALAYGVWTWLEGRAARRVARDGVRRKR